jgi:ankyrin repeat protein
MIDSFIRSYEGDINQPLDANWMTALINAAIYGQAEVVRALIKMKGNVNAVDK